MNYHERYTTLNSCFTQGSDFHIDETNIDVRFFPFHSAACSEEKGALSADSSIGENLSFDYPVFLPSGKTKNDTAILLLHGLNERSWNKYLPWAEYICYHTGKPVILFPIAFHMNRSPQGWSNPRNLMNLLNFRRKSYEDDRSISFANVALSERISEKPERFYLSGRQTWADLTSLFGEIKTGRHPLFKEGTQIDIFAYSIGAFLSQVALMANDQNLFTDSRLFMFCGGSIFRSMFGVSRSIMDKAAFERLQNYYIHTFGSEPSAQWEQDNAFYAFNSMISPDKFRPKRETFFERLGKQLSGITLLHDRVIPYDGVREALGQKATDACVTLLDFTFPYTHENPFPVNEKDTTSVNAAFRNIFSRAAEFLG